MGERDMGGHTSELAGQDPPRAPGSRLPAVLPTEASQSCARHKS